jgi:hypothetical protein
MTVTAVRGRTLSVDAAREPAIAVRAYRDGDRAAVREICRQTAFRNLGAAAMLDDPELFADYWSAYYTDYEPESVLVATRGSQVIGYLFGCVDSTQYVRTMGRTIVPRVVARLAWRGATGRYRAQPRATTLFRWLAFRSWREAPAIDLRRFPVHYHANVLPAGYTRGLYTTMALRFLDACAARGETHLHGQVMDFKERGVWQRFVSGFLRAFPDTTFVASERASSLGTVLGIERPLVNRVWGSTISDFQRFLGWLNTSYAL